MLAWGKAVSEPTTTPLKDWSFNGNPSPLWDESKPILRQEKERAKSFQQQFLIARAGWRRNRWRKDLERRFPERTDEGREYTNLRRSNWTGKERSIWGYMHIERQGKKQRIFFFFFLLYQLSSNISVIYILIQVSQLASLQPILGTSEICQATNACPVWVSTGPQPSWSLLQGSQVSGSANSNQAIRVFSFPLNHCYNRLTIPVLLS